MTTEEADTGQNWAVFRLGYADIMHSFQLLDVHLWELQLPSVKPKLGLDQRVAKIEAWNRTNSGVLANNLIAAGRIPNRLKDALLAAVSTRNYFAHTILRDRYIVFNPDSTYFSQSEQMKAIDELVEIDRKITDLLAALDGI